MKRIRQGADGWHVPSSTGSGVYIVSLERQQCTCPDYETRKVKCKHLYAVEYTIRRETEPDGTVKETESVKVTRVTYRQNWPAYNAAQTNEKAWFTKLLAALCQDIPPVPQTTGRPRLPLADMVFASTFKVYSMFSGRRFTTDLRDAFGDGLIGCTPHFNSVSNYMADETLTPILKRLIEESAKPLKAVEVDFAVDSTGFATSVYGRWFDEKWGKPHIRQVFVKTHLMCGVKTNVVTAVEATIEQSADAPQLPAFVAKTAETFAIREVSADKAYSSRRNLRAIAAVEAKPFIPFKDKTTGMGHSFDALWNYMWAYYQYNRDDFLTHYHKRSNVETTFSMIKAKFGPAVKSKTATAQVNEVLCKVLAHNIVVLIGSMYELGIEPTFCADTPVAQEVAL